MTLLMFVGLAALLIVAPEPVNGPVPVDPRCAHATPEAIPRDAKGRIVRSRAAVAQFQRANPCPSTGKRFGSCDGWAVDHVFPLANGGADATINMQWLPLEIKSAANPAAKDRWERRVNRCW